MKQHYSLIFILIASASIAQSWQWGKRGGSIDTMYNTNYPEQVRSMAADSQGNIYLLSPVGTTGLDVDGHVKTGYSYTTLSDYMISSFSCDGSYRWSKVIGGYREDQMQRLQIDANDNIYAVGKCEAPAGTETAIHFDTDLVIPVSPESVNTYKRGLFIIKYNSAGAFQWVRVPQPENISLLDNYQDTGSIDMQLDSQGNSFWLMHIKPGSYADGNYVVSQTGYYIFRYDAAGTFLGAMQLDMDIEADWNRFKMVRNAATGVFYISGDTVPSSGEFATFGGQLVTHDSSIAAYDGQGIFLWKKETSGTISGGFKDISLDENGLIYITGEARNGYGFGGHDFNATTPNTFPFILKLDANGDVIWGTNSSSVNASTSARAIIKGAMTGSAGSITWDSSSITVLPGSGYDVFMTRFNPDTEAIINIESIADDDGYDDWGTALAADHLGNIYVGGEIAHQMSINGTTLTNDGPESDFFVAKFGSDNCSLGIPEKTKVGFTTYPNPVKNILHIENTSGDYAYTIYGLLGQQLSTGKSNAASQIDFESYPVGIYLVELKDNSGATQRIKIIKE